MIKLGDPVGKVEFERELKTGLVLRKKSVPIGVIAIIFEARPEVVIDITILGIMSGNAVILKGGKDAENTNRVLGECVREGLKEVGIVEDGVQLVESRKDIVGLLGCEEDIDLIIPRGSKDLVKFIKANTKIPVMGHADGLCAVFVDEEADVEKAFQVVVDSKVQNPAVCNAAETLLIHQQVPNDVLRIVVQVLTNAEVALRCDDQAYGRIRELTDCEVYRAKEKDFDTEFLELIIAVKMVKNVDEAIEHINAHGSGHTDCIVTENVETAQKFLDNVDSAGTYHNVTTRYADGFRYGFGAEVGISTNKIHARGPVGLDGLLTYKYELVGQGHTLKEWSKT